MSHRRGEIAEIIVGALPKPEGFLCENIGLPHGVWKCCQCQNLCKPSDNDCHFCGHCKCCPCE